MREEYTLDIKHALDTCLRLSQFTRRIRRRVLGTLYPAKTEVTFSMGGDPNDMQKKFA